MYTRIKKKISDNDIQVDVRRAVCLFVVVDTINLGRFHTNLYHPLPPKLDKTFDNDVSTPQCKE